jgi:hypothetical protein
MMDGELTTGHRRALLGVVAGTCISLSACGATAGAAPGTVALPSTAIPASTQRFCDDVSAAMSSLAGQNPSGTMTLAQARHVLDSLLNNGIRNFTALEGKAPPYLRTDIKVIVKDFRRYEAQAAKAKTVTQLIDSTVTANPVDKHAYQELLGYTATSC